MLSKRHSLITVFLGIFLAGVLAIVLVLGAVFINSFRTTSSRETENFLKESSSHLATQITAQLQERVDLMSYAGRGAMADMTADFIDEGKLQDYYDNRTRSWWADAKAAGGKPFFTDPYVDLITNELVVTISHLMFDDRGREVAIVAEDISMARLDAITNSASGIEKTQNFLIHKSGKYITNKDSKKIMGALDTLQETTKQVRSGSDRIQEESGSIQGTVDSLKNISKEVNTSVLDVEQASQGIAASLEIARKIAEGKYLVPPEIAACG